MRRYRRYIVLLGITILLAITNHVSGGNKQDVYKYEELNINSFQQLFELFKNVPNSYRSAPLWTWNDKMTKENIFASLKEMKEMGMGGVFIHPRSGLITEYLSDEYLELVRYSIDEGKKLGLLVWLYDENSYPSGFAGGHVTRTMPELENRAQGLRLEKHTTLTPEKINESYIIIENKGGKFSDVTESVKANIKGEFYIFIKTYNPKLEWHGGSTYVDLLDPKVTEKFLEITMTNGFEKIIKEEELGTVVPGIFSDEPEVFSPGVKEIRFTPTLFEKFNQRWGYNLKSELPALFEEIGNWRKVRHDYYKLLLEMFIDGWSKPYHNYTESKGLRWTGHYWEHQWPWIQGAPDNMAMYEWHQMPAIDMLFNNNEIRPDQFGNVFAVKELSSIANQLDKPRVLSETYGASGWEISFADMKRQGDWQYVLGVNFLNQHLSYMTIKGGRKRDHPVSFTHHSPWWKQYKVLNDYFGRLSLALSSGEQKNEVLVIEPTTTVWMHFSPLKTEPSPWVWTNRGFVEDIGKSFHKFLKELEKNKIEYDLGSEQVIERNGKVKGNTFIIGSRAYSIVILPEYFINIENRTFTLLKDYLKNGGKVISHSDIPEYIDGEKTNDVKKLASDYANQWIQVDNPDELKTFIPENSLFRIDNVENMDKNVFHHRREFKDGQLIFLTNYNDSSEANIAFSAKGKDVSLLNTVSGEIEKYPFKSKDGWVTLTTNLKVAGSSLFFIHNNKTDIPRVSSLISLTEIEITTEPSEITRKEPNVLTLDYCNLLLKGEEYNSIYVLEAQNKIYKAFTKLGHNPWSGIQYKTNIIDMGKEIPENAEFKVTYPFIVAKNAGMSSLQAVIEWTHLYNVYINGKKVKFEKNKWWLDHSFNVFDIGKYVVEGKNELTIEANPVTIFSEIESVYLLGDFSLVSYPDGWKINKGKDIRLGSWKEQGMPFYSDHISYKKNFTIDSDNAFYKVKLNKWKGTVAEIVVNGKKAGIIGWPPYELDISKYVNNGENVVEVNVYGSTRNVLGPHHGDPNNKIEWARNIPGYTSPASFVGKPNQPAGKDYFLLDYGLYEDFSIVKKIY